MADYSKEYCALHMGAGFIGDFSIVDEVVTIPVNHYRSIICEGYGFIAIGKSLQGVVELGFRFNDPASADEHTVWIPFVDLEAKYQAGELPWQLQQENQKQNE